MTAEDGRSKTQRAEVPRGEAAVLAIFGWGSYGHRDARAAGSSLRLPGLPSRIPGTATDAAVARDGRTAESSRRILGSNCVWRSHARLQ